MPDERSATATVTRPSEVTQAPQMRVRWDDTGMKSSYANVCNVASTREEVVLLFGINQAWHAGLKEIPVQLTDRIIVSPHAAKRLSILLDNVLREYESRFGSLPDPRTGA